MSILETLNSKQREAASITDSHVRIIAGAGSGKTRVLMARIVYLVKECGVFQIGSWRLLLPIRQPMK